MQKRISLSFSFGFLATNMLKKNINNSEQTVDTTRNAICILYPENQSNVKGLISFQQENYTSPTKIVANVQGLNPNGLHGLHICQYGDLTQGSQTLGSIYNPFNKQHGSPLDSERQVGGLGNLKADELGRAYMAVKDDHVKLFGDHNVLGRSCVVKSKQDDYGRGKSTQSAIDGNSGASLASGSICLANAFKNLPPK